MNGEAHTLFSRECLLVRASILQRHGGEDPPFLTPRRAPPCRGRNLYVVAKAREEHCRSRRGGLYGAERRRRSAPRARRAYSIHAATVTLDGRCLNASAVIVKICYDFDTLLTGMLFNRLIGVL